MRAYAEKTKVPIERSRTEIENLFRKYKAEEFAYSQQGRAFIIVFKLHDRVVRFTLERAIREVGGMGEERAAQENRRRWRSLVLILKAKLEAVHSGILTMDEEFLPYTQMADGRTVAEWAVTELHPALSAGTMPRALLGPGK